MSDQKDPGVGIREFVERVLHERHLLYEKQFEAAQTAVAAALAAQKEAIAAALTAQKEAVVKAENKQDSYNATHNDLVRQMGAQYEHMMPRTEALGLFENLRTQVAELKVVAAAGAGKSAGFSAGWGLLVGAVGLAGAIFALLRGHF